MSVWIERKGRDGYRAECTECGCVFTYLREDVSVYYGLRSIECPTCGHRVAHIGTESLLPESETPYRSASQPQSKDGDTQ